MSNVSDLKALLVTAAGELTNTIDKTACLSDIDSWYNLRVAHDTLSTHDLSSYTVAGRTFQKKDLATMATQERQLWARINDYLYGRAAILADNRVGVP